MRRLSYSKLILIGMSVMTALIVVFSCVMIYRTGDLTPLAYLIPAVFAELATATGFYFRKAEKENTKGGIVYDVAMKGQNDENRLD